MSDGFSERRVTMKICEYWKSIHKDDGLPSKDDIDLEEISDLLPYCVIIEIKSDSRDDFFISYVGNMVEEFYEKGIFDSSGIQFVSPNLETFQEYIDEVYETREPISESGVVVNSNEETVKYRQCVLP